jgi:hypothetical protein
VPAPLLPYRLIVSKGSYYSQSFDVSRPSFHDSVLFTLVEIPGPSLLLDAIDPSDPSIIPIRTGFVSGRVLSPAGRPVEDVSVQAINPFEGSGSGRTSRDGTFIIPVSLSRKSAIPVTVTAFPPPPIRQPDGQAAGLFSGSRSSLTSCLPLRLRPFFKACTTQGVFDRVVPFMTR